MNANEHRAEYAFISALVLIGISHTVTNPIGSMVYLVLGIVMMVRSFWLRRNTER